MPELAGIIFYVGKGTNLSRMNDHLREAAREDCNCAKCEAIRSVWAVGLVVTRNIVFTSKDERATLDEESRRIVRHYSPHLTNLRLPKELTSPLYPENEGIETNLPEISNEPDLYPGLVFSDDHDAFITREELQEHMKKNYPGGGLCLSSPLKTMFYGVAQVDDWDFT